MSCCASLKSDDETCVKINGTKTHSKKTVRHTAGCHIANLAAVINPKVLLRKKLTCIRVDNSTSVI